LALKGHFAGIVAAALWTIAATAMAVGASGWSIVVGLAIVLWMYHIRCNSKERHDEKMAQLDIDRAVANVEAIKARYRELLSAEQPSLGFENRPGSSGGRRGRKS
jgi:hypothetical protein